MLPRVKMRKPLWIAVTAILSILFSTPLFAQIFNPEAQVPEERSVIPSIVGRWDSQLLSTEGNSEPVAFVIGIQVVQRDLRADLLNGPSRIPFSKIEWKNSNLTLSLEQYDGTIEAHCADKACDALTGFYSRQKGSGTVKYKFLAARHPIDLQHAPTAWTWPSLEGNWTFTFDLPEGNNERVSAARFTQGPAEGTDKRGADAEVNGTIAPVSGDLGLMHGTVVVDDLEKKNVKYPRFQLSRFDGIHIVLLKGQVQADGTLAGYITFSFTKPTMFTAVRATPAPQTTGSAALPNPETLTSVKDSAEPFHFSGIDPLSGQTVTEADPRFRGKAVIVDIFGTWCPNCHDEAPLLADLYNRYRTKGLEIVGLSYEYTADQARSERLLKIYRDAYGIQFPLLLTGTTEAGQIAKTLPQLVNFGAYPTTIFLDRQGHVHAIHAGFEGPATGNFAEVKARFEQLVEELTKPVPESAK
jgi:thiol-disulfide isomerase/thioredoxin